MRLPLMRRALWPTTAFAIAVSLITLPAGAAHATQCPGPPPISPQLSVSPLAVTVTEGGTAGYSVRLTARPAGRVTVTSTASTGDTNITITAGATLTFTPANWETNQTVTLAAAEDADQIAGVRAISVTAPSMATVTVTATEADNDICACPLPVTPTVLSVPEGGSSTFTVRLPSPPVATVTVTLTGGTGGDPDLTICSSLVLVFTPANWNIPQIVRVCAAEDADAVNGTRTFTIAFFGGTPVTVTATEADNDLPA